MEAISNEICQQVRNKIDIKTIFKKSVDPIQAIADIESGIQVLDRWQQEFLRTRQEIERDLTNKMGLHGFQQALREAQAHGSGT